MFLNFRISNALNKSEALPGGLQRQIERSPSAQRTAASYQELNRRLKREELNFSSPPSLHTSIMSKLYSARAEPRVAAWWPMPRWVPVFGFALIVLVFFGLLAVKYFHQAPPGDAQTASLASAGSVLQLGNSIVTEAPVAAISPISEEIQRLDLDLAATQQFILATIP